MSDTVRYHFIKISRMLREIEETAEPLHRIYNHIKEENNEKEYRNKVAKILKLFRNLKNSIKTEEQTKEKNLTILIMEVLR